MAENNQQDQQGPELEAQTRELTEEELERLKRDGPVYWSELGNLYSA